MNDARVLILTVAAAAMAMVGITFAQESDEGTIRALTQRYAEAYTARDAAALVEVFAEDAIFIAPDGTRMDGRDTILAMFSEYFTGDTPRLTIRDIETVAHGDVAYSLQAYEGIGADGETVVEGFGLAVWRQIDGEWSWFRNVANVILPEPVVNGSE